MNALQFKTMRTTAGVCPGQVLGKSAASYPVAASPVLSPVLQTVSTSSVAQASSPTIVQPATSAHVVSAATPACLTQSIKSSIGLGGSALSPTNSRQARIISVGQPASMGVTLRSNTFNIPVVVRQSEMLSSTNRIVVSRKAGEQRSPTTAPKVVMAPSPVSAVLPNPPMAVRQAKAIPPSPEPQRVPEPAKTESTKRSLEATSPTAEPVMPKRPVGHNPLPLNEEELQECEAAQNFHTFNVVLALSGDHLTTTPLPLNPPPTVKKLQEHLQRMDHRGQLVQGTTTLNSGQVGGNISTPTPTSGPLNQFF